MITTILYQVTNGSNKLMKTNLQRYIVSKTAQAREVYTLVHIITEVYLLGI